MSRSLPILVALSLAAPQALAGQEASHRFDAARHVPAAAVTPPGIIPPAPAPAAASAAADAREGVEQQRQGRSFLSSLLHTMGGALVGGWVGYVGSQVTLSDWEKEHNSAFNGERAAWVAGGAVVGILGSRLIGGTRAPGAPTLEVQRPRSGRNVLSREEIESSGAVNVYELVNSTRHDWLVPRGVNSIRESARGSGTGFGPEAQLSSTPGKASVVVYLDDLRVGEIERMREFLVNDIQEIRFIEPQEAAYRYGAGHSHGVILLKTVR